ncbi:MAG: amidase family protein, partial [Phenylobacterium sp.]|nr:amidase family protein [Phenylobacterium sp.]
ADPDTAQADAKRADYLAALDRDSLKGARIGVWHGWRGRSPATDAVFEAALDVLRAQGATLIELKGPGDAVMGQIGQAEVQLMTADFGPALDAYLATTPAAVRTRTLADVVAFNRSEPRETAIFDQDLFETAAATPADPERPRKRAELTRLARETLDRMLATERLDAIVSPSGGPASIVDPVNGGVFFGSPSRLPAVSGYPHLTVPMGYVVGLPVGMSFLGPAWSEARLLSLGFAYEQASKARREPEFPPHTAARPEIGRAYDPR